VCYVWNVAIITLFRYCYVCVTCTLRVVVLLRVCYVYVTCRNCCIQILKSFLFLNVHILKEPGIENVTFIKRQIIVWVTDCYLLIAICLNYFLCIVIHSENVYAAYKQNLNNTTQHWNKGDGDFVSLFLWGVVDTYKKRPCLFCGKQQSRLKDILVKHKEEPRVDFILKLPSKEIGHIITNFRREAILTHNKKCVSIVRRMCLERR